MKFFGDTKKNALVKAYNHNIAEFTFVKSIYDKGLVFNQKLFENRV